ncbi:MAG: hypothetical protein K2F83_06495, partial [Oscillospiraceae bacterium]|nr:hypothetical protein [Oscillospiraceae bacterium]
MVGKLGTIMLHIPPPVISAIVCILGCLNRGPPGILDIFLISRGNKIIIHAEVDIRKVIQVNVQIKIRFTQYSIIIL